MKETRTTMFTQMNLIRSIYCYVANHKKVWLTLSALLLVTLVHAQCPGAPDDPCSVTIGTRTIQYPSGTICDNNWGWDPWGAARSQPVDPKFTENGGVYPNNDGHIIAGYNFVADCACECPVYYDKLFYIDPAQNNFTRQFKIPRYPLSKIRQVTPIDERYSHLGIIFTTSDQYNEPCEPQEMIITPRPSDAGNPIRVNQILYGKENASTFCGWFYSFMRSFTYTIELPQWKPEANIFHNICQENRSYNLADYFSVSGVTFNLDRNHRDTIWAYPTFPCGPFICRDKDYQRRRGLYKLDYIYTNQINPQDLTPGVHTLYAAKTYDNGAYNATFGSERGEVEFPFTFTVLPAAPVVVDLSVTPSCPGEPSGAIAISGVTGGDGNYRFILRNGHNNNNPCDPNAGNCFDVSTSGSFSGGNYTITQRPPGDYTLWIANNGGNTGACARTYNVSIDRLSYMDTLPIAIQHISCPGGSNGFIHVTDTGGKAPYTFSLTAGSLNLNNTDGIFNSLASGAYTMSTSDGCGTTVQRTITLTEPLPVNITATPSATDCNNPANGLIDITASGGSGTFDYYLYDNNGITVAQQLNSATGTWSIPALPAGNYTASVKNTAAAGCDATTQPVVVDGPQAISISYVSQTNNNCSYDALGTVELSATGGQENGYTFFLQNTSSGETIQSATGSFSNLPAASYKAWVRNRDVSCLDSAIYATPVIIAAPPAFTILTTATDITCNSRGDGTLQAGITGGTPGYNLQWQQWDDQAANWLTLSGRNNLSENNLQQGTYRLLVTDQNSCTGFSNTVDIAEPGPLLITSVLRNDIVCYGGSGSIQMNVSGGNGSYVYSQSADNGNSWNAFTTATALQAASYQLKVNDAKGCETPYTQPVIITAPAAPLAITYTLTDYNGFNVPCFGSTNGVVQLQATGGNGSTYTGYTFTVDNGTYTAAATVSTGAGSRTFSVKDARGCVASATTTLTQPASQMQSTIAGKRDNDCAAGQSGEITVSTTGGTPQYTFSINGTNFQQSPVFSGLLSGNYQFTTRDVNGCISTVNETIVDLNPPITNQASIDNVLCFNGSDGRITLSAGGGVAPYSYTWQNSSVTGDVLSGLPTGNYSVTITDSKGCTLSNNFTVDQPLQPLTVTTYARPVCINNPNGHIVFHAQGGTSPYRYSIDAGAGYSNNVQFNNLAAGNYPVKVIDTNGCTWSNTAAVVINGINPTLNFLVSTSQNALDTLQVLDICTPKPDSIHWTFDPQTVIIENNMFSPLIRFNKEGSYPVTMKAWFAGCDFNTSKVITINPYDPNVVNNYNNQFGIDTVVVAPNPNNGNFNLKVKLFKKQRLIIKIYSVAGTVLWNKQWDYISEVQEPVSLPPNIGNGIVFIKVITDNDMRDVEMIISK